MASAELSICGNIPGVFDARQKRSVRIRDSFIDAGVDLLNSTRLEDLSVSELAKSSGNSVGGFYTRFKDKDAYFRALRAFTIQSLENDFIADFNNDSLKGQHPEIVLGKLVDLMLNLFTSRYRGVLRESLILILEPDDPWAPMRESAQKIITVLQLSLSEAFPDRSSDETDTQLRFCFQLIVGTLQNDLINNYHVFTTKDDSLRIGLKQAVCRYMGVKYTVVKYRDVKNIDVKNRGVGEDC